MEFSLTLLTSRNIGYVTQETQDKILNTRILIAGCGIGSQVAECAARMGFRDFVLIDGDTVDVHNLNRQFFFADQVGKNKTDALAENLLRINPLAKIETHALSLTRANARDLVRSVDVIFDTIDFLDLDAIVALHDEAFAQRKLLVSAFGVGFGAACLLIPNQENSRKHSWIRDIFDIPSTGDLKAVSYAERYMNLVQKIAHKVDPLVISVMQRVFQEMADGRPCPAPQVCPGAHTVASLSVTAVVRYLGNHQVAEAPVVVISNLLDDLSHRGVALAT